MGKMLWVHLLLVVALAVPVVIGAQSQTKDWTDPQCREFMTRLFNMAVDPSVDMSEVTQHLGDRAGTEFSIFCRTREAKSLQMLRNRLRALEADRRETDEADWRVNSYGKHQENSRGQSPTYDPNGMPGRM
jgi:hypothetical protein